MEWKYTRQQVARGSRPDDVGQNDWLLIKTCSLLRLTYQIRLLTFFAIEKKTRLTVVCRADVKLSDPLAAFLEQHKRHVRLDRRI
ncbi:MAG: hypothetical protein GY788_25195 [bacterium]|nr:hypothetical protein [bacterium]